MKAVVLSRSGRVLGVALLLGACGLAPPPARQVILISLDTTRADHLGCYGNPAVRTPAIDAFCADAVVFESCTADSHFTLPSHASIFTSLHMKDHGVVDNRLVIPEFPGFMPKLFRERAFTTAAFVSSKVLARKVNFSQGFDLYDEPAGKERRAAETSSAALGWFAEHRDDDFFVWLHYFDPHMFYDPPPPYDTLYTARSSESFEDLVIENREWFEGSWRQYLRRSDDPEHYRNLYKGEISYLDEHLGRLFDGLRELGIYRDGLIVMTADHGENLGARGRYFVHRGVYDDTMRVPCIFKLPRLTASGARRQLASTLDIYPTVFALAAIDHRQTVRGRDLSAILRDPQAPEVRRALIYQGARGTALGIKTPAYTFVQERPGGRGKIRGFLFDNGSDATQVRDLSDALPAVRADLERLAERFLADRLPLPYRGEEIADERHLRLLRSLGYLD